MNDAELEEILSDSDEMEAVLFGEQDEHEVDDLSALRERVEAVLSNPIPRHGAADAVMEAVRDVTDAAARRSSRVALLLLLALRRSGQDLKGLYDDFEAVEDALSDAADEREGGQA